MSRARLDALVAAHLRLGLLDVAEVGDEEALVGVTTQAPLVPVKPVR